MHRSAIRVVTWYHTALQHPTTPHHTTHQTTLHHDQSGHLAAHTPHHTESRNRNREKLDFLQPLPRGGRQGFFFQAYRPGGGSQRRSSPRPRLVAASSSSSSRFPGSRPEDRRTTPLPIRSSRRLSSLPPTHLERGNSPQAEERPELPSSTAGPPGVPTGTARSPPQALPGRPEPPTSTARSPPALRPRGPSRAPAQLPTQDPGQAVHAAA